MEPGQRERVLFDALTKAADAAGMGVSVMYVTDDGARNAYFNDASVRLLGVTREELAQRPMWSSVAPEELPRLTAMHERRLAGEPLPTNYETVLLRPDGTRVPVEIATSRLELDGEFANVTFVQDITRRKQAQAALERSEARFRALAENAPDGIAITRWPNIVYLNRTAALMLGFESPEQAVGSSLLERLTPVGAQLADQRVAERFRGERTGGIAEYTVRGSNRVVEVSASAIEYDGAPAMLGFARDITERKAIVARLMESEKLAAIGTLAAGVAHEVNNPLAYLLLNIEILIRQLPKLLEDPTLLPSLGARLEQARHGGERVKTIVRDLQTFTRRDDGEGGPVLLDAAIDAALSIAGHELRHTISIVRRFELVPAVLGNATRYEQLFLNLILNAAHALAGLPLERRVIELELRASPGAGDKVIASVRDHGVGMCAETLGRALEPFFTTKPLGAGTGLGLSICQNIVHAAGGTLNLKSEQGVGTTVQIELPAYRGKAPRKSSHPPEVREPVRRASLLVIDDETAITNSIAFALEDEHDVVCCSSAAAALALLRSGRHFDVVLCDLVMPERDGTALFSDVSAELPELAARFVFMTGGASLPHAQRFLDEVQNPRLDKPFALDTLRALLRTLL